MEKSSAFIVLRELIGHTASINSIRYTTDGNYCMTCSDDRSLKLWNPHKDDPNKVGNALSIKTYSGVHGYSIQDVVISSDNNKFASAGGDRVTFLWDVGTGRVIRRIQGHSQRINCLEMNEDSTILLTGSYDKTVKVWDLRSNMRDPMQSLDDFKDSVTSIKKTNHQIISSCVDGKLRIYDLRFGSLQTDSYSDPITSLAVTNDKNCTLSSCLGSTIMLTEMATGRLLQFYRGHVNEAFKVETCITNDDSRVMAGSEDGSIYMWDLVDAHIMTRHKAHTKAVSSIQYHPSQSVFLTASFDGSAKCWMDKHPS